MAFEILKSRIGRWLNEQFNIKKKILCTFNPRKTWIDTFFYRPFVKKEETPQTKFIPSFATDNPFLPADYIDTLKNLKDEATKQRLLYGNFDYDDDPATLIPFDIIQNMFTNIWVKDGTRYITADVARFGSDSTVIFVWSGFKIIDYFVSEKTSMIEVQKVINTFRLKHSVMLTNIIADEDGIGGGVVDNLNIKGFVARRTPTNKNYNSFKDECGYILAEKAKEMYIECRLAEMDKDKIMQELAQLKTYLADNDGKLRIMPKEKIKENIGRSPDFLDNFVMRMYFELKKQVYAG